MGLYNFQRQFVPFVLNGSKQHTIRATRKVMDKPGDTCHLYTGLRQKGAQLLGRVPCIRIEEIYIADGAFYPGSHPKIWVDEHALDLDEMKALACRDGFRGQIDITPFDQMMSFWKGRLPFQGHIVHWDWSRREAKP